MARRKRGYLDEGYSSDSSASDEDADADADARQRMRRQRRGKEDAALGIFGSGSEGENERMGGVGRTVRGRDSKGKRVDYLRGQAFVAGKANPDDAEADNANDEGEEDNMSVDQSDMQDSGDESDSSSEQLSEAERFANLPATEQEELETRNPFAIAPTVEEALAKESEDDPREFRPASFVSSRGGIGSAARQGIGAQRAGIGSESSSSNVAPRSGIGSLSQFKSSRSNDAASAMKDMSVPTTFGQASAHQSFSRFARDSSQRVSDANSDAAPKISFKVGSGFGGKFDPAKYLAQMGWTGGGLGKQGEGIVNPIEVKQRPERAGIAFGGLKEKTKQAKDEARRRGEQVSSDEEDRRKGRGDKKKLHGQQSEKEKSDRQAWTKAEKKPRKPKIEHRTYEQILEEHGHAQPTTEAQKVVDASGNEFNSISEALSHHSVPSNDSTQLVEIRHNLRLICESEKRKLDSLANEGAAIQDRRKWHERDRDEAVRRQKALHVERERINEVMKVTKQLDALGLQTQKDAALGIDVFEDPVLRILSHYKDAVAEFGIDAAIVGAMVPSFKRSVSQWCPLESPEGLAPSLSRLSGALRLDAKSEVMTPYESLLWNIWMPPVRSAFSNDWNVYDAQNAVQFYRVWSPIVSIFVRDNIVQQLILPKLRSAVSDWDGRMPLHKAVFPWMPLLVDQMDDIVSEAKRRLRNSLKTWKVSAGVPNELTKWRDVFRSNEWNAMLLQNVVDKLSTHLDMRLEFDRKLQNMAALEQVLAWRPLMPEKIMSKLLAARFVPKLIQSLHAWLCRADANFEEIALWYEDLKTYLQQQGVGGLQAVRVGLQAALRLMEQALQLGVDERKNLSMLDLKALQHAAGHSTLPKTEPTMATSARTDADTAAEDNTDGFRQIVEETAAENDLLVQPLNKTDVQSGLPLYRISRSLDGQLGTTFYLDEDVVFAQRQASQTSTQRAVPFEPVSVDELIRSVR